MHSEQERTEAEQIGAYAGGESDSARCLGETVRLLIHLPRAFHKGEVPFLVEKAIGYPEAQ